MYTRLWNYLGDLFTKSFELLPIVGNKINYLYIVIILSFLVLWTVQMFKHSKEKNNN